ncbi:MAG: DUF2817 domain-containing protein [Pedobacter sp.]|nr:MAG: DUF2817 domain-containing protein [Pedobacter sp.]
MNISSVLASYGKIREMSITNRFLKHADVLQLIGNLSESFKVKTVGTSEENRSLNLVTWGKGITKIFIWSQMHGDEATGTMAIFDLLNLLGDKSYSNIADHLSKNCTLYFLPMVNPDGAERFLRRNANQIDLNRDYLKTVSAESKILKSVREQIAPHFGFNLHDQETLWSVKHTGKPATLSYLAPAYDEALSVNEIRTNAMLVVADIFHEMNQLLPNQIGLFDDEHEPRAFGDNFQAEGTSTILIEAGGLHMDPEKQQIRTYYMLSMLAGLRSICSQNYLQQNVSNYYAIPSNDKQIFHILIHNVTIGNINTSIGVNYAEQPTENGLSTIKTFVIKDIGDLNFCWAYETYKSPTHTLQGDIVLEQYANFNLLDNGEIILAFKDGLLH